MTYHDGLTGRAARLRRPMGDSSRLHAGWAVHPPRALLLLSVLYVIAGASHLCQ